MHKCNEKAPKVILDYPWNTKPFTMDEFVSELKLIGIGLLIVASILAIEHFKNS